MKKILVVIMLLVVISAFADLAEEGIDERLALHFGGGFVLSSVNHIALSNIKFTQDHAEDWNFYLTTAGIVIEELYSNNWEGVKFWKVTSAVVGMTIARKVWDGKRPLIYPVVGRNSFGLQLQVGI